MENLLKPIFPKNIMKYEESEIMNNTNAFQESILNKSFFDENKLIIMKICISKYLYI